VENFLVNRHVFISERTGDKIDISSMQTAIAEAQAKKDGVEFNKFTGYQLKTGQSEVKPFVVSWSNHERLNRPPFD
jgi:hypothetical protein